MMMKINRRKLTEIMKKIGQFAKENQQDREKVDNYFFSIFDYENCCMDGLEDGTGCFLPGKLFDIQVKPSEVKKELGNDSKNFKQIFLQKDFGIFIEYNKDKIEVYSTIDVTYRTKDGILDFRPITIKSIEF